MKCLQWIGYFEYSKSRGVRVAAAVLAGAGRGGGRHAARARILQRGAGDDDERVVVEIKRASELFGYFITPDTWWPLLEADMDSWSTLLVLSEVLKGSQRNLVAGKVLDEMCGMLAQPDYCRTRKPKYQTNLMRVADATLTLCDSDCRAVADQLFTACFTVYAMPHDNKIQFMALSNLDKLRFIEQLGPTLPYLYAKHIPLVLSAITSDALTWDLMSPDRCLLETVLVYSDWALGPQLHLIAPLLKECLATPKVDPEVKLKMFTTLSTVLLKRQDNFRKAEREKLEAFLKIVIEDVIVPNLVWSPGRTAEAIRTAAVACLCSALQEHPQSDAPLDETEKGEGDSGDEIVNLFPTKESLEPFLDQIVPLLVGLVEDNSALTRQHSLRAVCYLTTVAKQTDCFTAELLHKLYFVVLKRLDDSNDKVRSFAVQTLRKLFTNRPRPYDTILYGAHIDAMYSAMLVHLDDNDEAFRKEMLDALLTLSDVEPKLLEKKVNANVHLYRNKAAYERLSSHIDKLKI